MTMTQNMHDNSRDRTFIRAGGKDVFAFLQGLITNDMARARGGLIYAALLSPQGKYLFDFFVLGGASELAGGFLIDIQSDCAEAFLQRLNMYKLRADVVFEVGQASLSRGLGTAQGGAYPDPRHAALGWRSYSFNGDSPDTDAPSQETQDSFDALYVKNLIPRTGAELLHNETYILEAGFERLNGVDFQKGCYVGQEVTARMKHKTTLRKGLALVRLEAAVPVGCDIMAGDRVIGRVFSQADGLAIAYLRFELAKGELFANGVPLVVSC